MIWRVFSSDFDHCDLRVSLSDHFYSSNELLINYNACHLCDEMFMITLVEIFFFRFSLELSGLLEWFLQFGLIVHKIWYRLFQLFGSFSSLFSMNFFFVFRSPSWNFFPIFSDLLWIFVHRVGLTTFPWSSCLKSPLVSILVLNLCWT